MQHSVLPLAIVGIAIILALASYAGWLLSKLYKQNQQRQQLMQAAIVKRNSKIVESVNIIALAALQKQCDLSEAAIRLYMIMDQLQGSMQLAFPTRFPALFELYQVVENMPRGEARKKMAKHDRMKADFARMDAEARLEAAILPELEEILIFTGAKTTLEQVERT